MHQEELSLLRRQNVSRSLSFRAEIIGNSKFEDIDAEMEDLHGLAQQRVDELNDAESCQSIRVSTKQVYGQQLLVIKNIMAAPLKHIKFSRHVIHLSSFAFLIEKTKKSALSVVSQL